MTRTNATNYTTHQFPIADASTDPVHKEDIQTLASAVDDHTHGSGKGAAVARLAANAVDTASIQANAVTTAKLAANAVTGTELAAGYTMRVLGSASGNGVATSLTVSSIPATYRHLVLSFIGGITGASDQIMYLTLNGDSAANYVYSADTTATVTGASSIRVGFVPASGGIGANYASSYEIVIPNYTTTQFYKQTIGHGAGYANIESSFGNTFVAGSWKSTSAITSVSLATSPAVAFQTNSQLIVFGMPLSS